MGKYKGKTDQLLRAKDENLTRKAFRKDRNIRHAVDLFESRRLSSSNMLRAFRW